MNVVGSRTAAAFAALSLILTGISALSQPLTAIVRLKERIPLELLAQSVRQPGSSRFGQFFAPEEIRSLSGPVDDDYDQLLAELKNDGFQIVSESGTHLWVGIQGDAALFDKVFNSRIQQQNSALGFLRKNYLRPQVP